MKNKQAKKHTLTVGTTIKYHNSAYPGNGVLMSIMKNNKGNILMDDGRVFNDVNLLPIEEGHSTFSIIKRSKYVS